MNDTTPIPEVSMKLRLLAVVITAVVIGCGETDTAPSPPADTTNDAAQSDALLGDVLQDTGPTEPPWDPPPLAEGDEPEDIDGVQWRMLYVGNKPDPVIGPLLAGTFSWPEEGVDGDYWWKDEAPNEDGVIPQPSYDLLLYAVARFESDVPRGLVVKTDAVYQVFLNGARQPGDPYAHNQHRVALRAQAGENLVVFRIIGRGKDPAVGLWETEDELAFNHSDVTWPDLVAGDTTPRALGLPVLNLTDAPLLDVRARVVESDHLEETVRRYPALGTLSATQVAFELQPKGSLTEVDTPVTATLRVESPSLSFSYETTVDFTTVSADPAEKKTVRVGFFSPVDDSAQYYGLLRPAQPDAGDGRALVLSLHGASVKGINQANSYSAKDDMVLVAPTNRRRFGFDWELWGRLNGLNAMAHAKTEHDINPKRVYLTGHSMGGHGTWQFGSLFPGKFAVVGPSAGWISFETYGGSPFPEGPFGWARHSSDTLRFISNLAKRAVYIIHGSADDNVPISQSQTMFNKLLDITPLLEFHIEPGAGHWWNGDMSDGVDCVDWPPLIATMDSQWLDPWEMDFNFVSPSPWVSPSHSWVTLLSAVTPAEDMTVTSAREEDQVTVTTTNVRSLRIDTAPLLDAGVTQITVDGEPHTVSDEPIEVGPMTGKNPEVYGPVTQVFFRPFCYVYDPAGPEAYRRF
ncbi:MAG: prolyl oligopeptidase family serine peptidase, partial [Myxococcota bacterium]|nr:prolyl oligopeptidase family serine peptidase [Myxococcota bacterium]